MANDIQGAQSNFTQLSFLEETEWGTTPTTGTPQSVFFTGESLKVNKDVQISNQIESSGNVPESIDTKISASGGFNFELGMTKYLPFFRGAYRNTFDEIGTGGTGYDVDFEFVDSQLTTLFPSPNGSRYITIDTTNAEDLSFYNSLRIGQTIHITGATNSNNNGNFRIIAKAVVEQGGTDYSTITVDKDLTAEAATSVNVSGYSLINGILEPSFTLEKSWEDADIKIGYTGMRVSTSSLTVEPNSIITGSFEFMGRDERYARAEGGTPAVSIFGSRTPNTPIEEALVTGSDSVRGMVAVDNAALQTVMSLSLNTNSNLREQPVLGTKEIGGIGDGRLEVTGSLSAYLRAESELYEKFREHTPFSLAFSISDGVEALHFYMPKCYFTEGQTLASGINTDSMQEMEWQAHLDENLGNGQSGEESGGTIVISRTAA